MDNDLKIIKKKYGEDMMHFCRQSFPTILETPGLLSEILLKNFAEYRGLYQDILEANLITDFKKYILSVADKKTSNNQEQYKAEAEVTKTPKELLAEAGYELYRCHNEEEIQSFKKYYARGEELCTFKGGRLNRCHVFFAVKKDVANIKRQDFKKPDRQDLYGTSVISIQFDRGEINIVSIKNRYNHKVDYSDATFSNNLNNIIPGLEKSFEKTYHLNIKPLKKFGFNDGDFIIPSYKKCDDGKFYKYNINLNNDSFGPNNIIIDKDLNVKQYDKNEFIVFESYILDLKNKQFILLEGINKDSFLESLETIDKISVTKDGDFRKIEIFLKDDAKHSNPVIIKIDKDNRITELRHPYQKKISNRSFNNLIKLKEIDLPNLDEIGDYSFTTLPNLERLNLPKLRKIGNNSLFGFDKLKEVNLPRLEKLGAGSLSDLKMKLDLKLKLIILKNKALKLWGRLQFNNYQEEEITDEKANHRRH